mgnify:CR=1 FL=1
MTEAERNARIVEMVRQREKSLDEIGAIFGLTRETIGHIGKAAGVVRRRPTACVYEATPWSGAEADAVRRQYGKVKVRLLAQQLGRTRNEIIGKAHRLGLRACEAPSSTAQPAHEMVAT